MRHRRAPWLLAAMTLVIGCPEFHEQMDGDPDADPDDPEADDPEDDDPFDPSDPAPQIEIDPQQWSFDTTEVGCGSQTTLLVRNVGDAPLLVESWDYESSTDEMSVEIDGLEGAVLQPQAEHEVRLHWVPVDAGHETGQLLVASNDPDRPEAVAFHSGEAHELAEVTDEYTVGGSQLVDILWVIDNSSSMDDYQARLAANASDIADVLVDLDYDYQLAVATTDSGVFQGAVPIMTPATPGVRQAFADALMVGTDGEVYEMGLQYGLEALTPPLTDPGSTNEGFLRPQAGLQLFFLTDELDQSPDTAEAYLAAYRALKVDPDMVVVHGIMRTYCPKYEVLINATGGSLIDIEDPDWSPSLQDIQWDTPYLTESFSLSADPVADTIEVQLDGEPVHEGWIWDEPTNAIRFDPDHLPTIGAQISIRYWPQSSC